MNRYRSWVTCRMNLFLWLGKIRPEFFEMGENLERDIAKLPFFDFLLLFLHFMFTFKQRGGKAMLARNITDQNQIDLTTEENRSKLAKLLTNLFAKWELSTIEQLNLLGLSSTSRSVLTKYRRGSALASSRDMLDRAGWLLAIHKALRLLFPLNEALRYSWVKRRNRDFNNCTPLEVMMLEGIIGIAKVCRYLDMERGL